MLAAFSAGASRARATIPFIDCHPPADDFARETLAGLRQSPKQLPAKFFYDWNGSRLFEQICDTEEYYPTRTELGIFERYVDEMAVALGPDFTLIEYGSGSSRKLRLLCDSWQGLRRYVAIDISREFLRESAQALADDYPHLAVSAICADYTALTELPTAARVGNRKVVFFPGSTIGNSHPEEARTLLRQMAALAGSGGAILIGVDCKKDRRVLERAYNDAGGLTARFNLNLLRHLNQKLDCGFDPANFDHCAVYNEARGRIEMHLVCQRAHRIWLGKEAIDFKMGETIHTENSYKYAPGDFQALAREAGLEPVHCWLDDKEWFSVHYLRCI